MPDTTATMPAAAKALFMKSYWNMSVLVAVIVTMLVHVLDAFDVAAARHHEDVAVGAHHADVGAEQARQHRGGDDFLHGAEHRLAAAEIKHAVERAEQLVEFVRAE